MAYAGVCAARQLAAKYIANGKHFLVLKSHFHQIDGSGARAPGKDQYDRGSNPTTLEWLTRSNRYGTQQAWQYNEYYRGE